MKDSKKRALAIFGMLAAAVGMSCVPAAQNPPDARQIRLTIWVGCDTIDRDAVGGGTTRVEICAADDARLVGPGNAGAAGRPVARMRNLGTVNEARWNLRRDRIYIIAAYSSAAGGTYKIWSEGGGPAIKTGVYHACGHGGESPPTSSATFGECGEVGSSSAAGKTRASGPAADEHPRRGHVLLSPANGPAWISCTDGCCTTDAN